MSGDSEGRRFSNVNCGLKLNMETTASQLRYCGLKESLKEGESLPRRGCDIPW